MRLSTHYSKASIIITIAVLIAGAIIYFFTINQLGREQLDRNLSEEIEEVEDYVNLNGKLPKQVDFDEDQTIFIRTNQTKLEARFFDTVYNKPKEKETEPGRAVSAGVVVKGDPYKVIIIVSRESTENLIRIIGTITLVLVVGLLLILFVTNRYILKRLWKPFYETLAALSAFNVSSIQDLHLKKNKVDEFMELNDAVYGMALRVKDDYINLKHFTEDASHEMMTPLAVITAKLDTFIQDESLKPEQYDQIIDIYGAASKLTRLNHSLLLLVKIENNLVEDAEMLNLHELICQKIRQFQELANGKEITVIDDLEDKQVLVSKYLADILLNNLFSNAIRHNIEKGMLIITLKEDLLIFQNTGPLNTFFDKTLFERFRKGQRSDGTGLGLTIVKNICNLYHWDISYSFKDPLHKFQINLKKSI